jgi:hypothetical protein
MRVLLTVLGSLIALGLLVVSIFIFTVVPRVIATAQPEPTDPAAQRKLAASIANFDVPPGYKQSFGQNLLLVKTVTLMPLNPRRDFAIAIEGVFVPATTGERDPSVEGSLRHGLIGKCKNLETSAYETIRAKTRSIELRILRCSDFNSNLEVAFAMFPGTSRLATAMVIAMGNSAAFDLVAVRRLLASVR